LPGGDALGMRRLAVFAAVLVAALAAGGASAAPATVRVLVVKATWGPEPYPDAEVASSLQSVADFYAAASFGQVALSFTQTPWLAALPAAQPVSCGTGPDAPGVVAAATAAADAAGFASSSYDRVVVLLAASGSCVNVGFLEAPHVSVVNGDDAGVLAHELGHTFGMGHAGAVWCISAITCREDPYGDAWDVMGGAALHDFGAFQKARAGWLPPTYVATPGLYELAPVEEPSALSQALVVRTAATEYWIDHREALGADAYLAGDPLVTAGFEVHRIGGDPFATGADPFAIDYLVPVGRHNQYVVPPGETFSVPGVFALGDVGRADGVVTVRFRWLDTTKPTTPRFSGVSGHVVTFTSGSDTGSGVGHYLLTIDGFAPELVPGPPLPPSGAPAAQTTVRAMLPALARGDHTLSLVAVDRAGNRSAPATALVRG